MAQTNDTKPCTDMQEFDSPEFGTVRAMRGDDGEPWFVASDIAKALGYRDAAQLTRLLDDDEKGTQILRTPGGAQQMTTLNESGFYRAIMQRRSSWVKDDKRREFVISFQRWVTHEVLPSIRRHGGYMLGQEQMTPEQMALASMRWLESKVREQEARLVEQAAQLEAQKPKVLFADAVSASDGTCLVGELAKMLTQAGYRTGQNRLFARLRDEGYLGKSGSNRNVPLQKYVDSGLFRIKETAITCPDGHVTLNRTPKVTGKGQRYFLDKYAPADGARKVVER
ncbi:antirepressor [Pseudoscardovia radai]|uniref:Antirepressor n=1 Tax=Pseudoscardovia radai TaxID=987066 RepID=A0A261EY34_9BIFI|nr:phage antirepressor KilAC domain-containing protein [Pseudoscardovia radai]OZG51753.1 antirepressor [Pseudoscardovia radai]